MFSFVKSREDQALFGRRITSVKHRQRHATTPCQRQDELKKKKEKKEVGASLPLVLF